LLNSEAIVFGKKLLELSGLENVQELELFPNPIRRKRLRTTPDQLDVLEKVFQSVHTPNSSLRSKLSKELGMSSRRIQVWFQNRRAKLKKQKISYPTTILSPEPVSLDESAKLTPSILEDQPRGAPVIVRNTALAMAVVLPPLSSLLPSHQFLTFRPSARSPPNLFLFENERLVYKV
jgi:hypothetical protein